MVEIGSGMRDVVVLIPGILGSVLTRDGKDVWNLSPSAFLRGFTTLGKSIRDLELGASDDGIAATSLLPRAHLLPGLFKVDGYGRTSEFLRDDLRLQGQRQYFELPYDWRKDNRIAARRLAELAPTWLRAWQDGSGAKDARLVLVAHSMGGLIARYFLEVLEGWKQTRALITFGTPFGGALKALDVLSNGITRPLDLTSLTRSFSSVYQLLPTYRCLDITSTIDEAKRIPEVGAIRLNELEAPLAGLDPERLADAFRFHEEIREAEAANALSPEYRLHGYTLYPIVGRRQPTLQSARLSKDGRVVGLEKDHMGRNHAGDGTVPLVSLAAISDEARKRAMYVPKMHAVLQTLPEVLRHVAGVVEGLSISFDDFLRAGEQEELSLRLQDVGTVGEPIPVEVAGRSQTLDLEVVWSRIDAEEQGVLRLEWVKGELLYRAELSLPLEGLYRIAVRGVDRRTQVPVSVISDLLAVVGRDEAAVSPPLVSERVMVFDAEAPIAVIAPRLKVLGEDYGVASRPPYGHYAFRRSEIFRAAEKAAPGASIKDALDLRESDVSPIERADENVDPQSAERPTMSRRIRLGYQDIPKAVVDFDPTPIDDFDFQADVARTSPAIATDDGTVVRRSPIIDTDVTPEVGKSVKITVDLAMDAPMVPRTMVHAPFEVPVQPEWSEIDVEVRLSSSALEFEDKRERAKIVVRKDGGSVAAEFACRVRDHLTPGEEFEVQASFFHDGTFRGLCGRTFTVGQSSAAPTKGSFASPASAPSSLPVITVEIIALQASAPGRFEWSLKWNLNGNLEPLALRAIGRAVEVLDLGQRPQDFLSGIQGVIPSGGVDMTFVKGVGRALWNMAPRLFRDVYDAFRSQFERNFAIQFISDDWLIPWELMEINLPPGSPDRYLLCTEHPVARWPRGYMYGGLPSISGGKRCTVAPDYQLSQRGLAVLRHAAAESQHVATRYGGERVPARRAKVCALFTGQVDPSAGLIHFAGHGNVTDGNMMKAALHLEYDESIAPVDVQRVSFRDRARPLVILNACEVGSSMLAGFGGWGEALVTARCGGIIAPLWSVGDRAASAMVVPLLGSVLGGAPRPTVAGALAATRRLRLQQSPHDIAPLAYIFVGDVSAVCQP